MSFLQRFRHSLESLYPLPANGCYVVAYSGGMDSHTLLYACHRLGLPLRAVHVNHGLQAEADDWTRHCQQVCQALDVPLTVLPVDVGAVRGQSPEEAARTARYTALEQELSDGECLLTAQHRDDQAETLMLQLLRGGGSAGLAAMPACREFGTYVHLRPLLDFSRNEIADFAVSQGLRWVEDPSNDDTGFDRNFLRREIMPLLARRWPRLTTRLAHVAGLQAENRQVLDAMAAVDLADASRPVMSPVETGFAVVRSVLDTHVLMRLPRPRRMNLLRYWITTMLSQAPSQKLLEEIETALLPARADAVPVIHFHGCQLRRYRHGLYLLRPLPEKTVVTQLHWCPAGQTQLSLPQTGLTLRAVMTESGGLRKALLGETFTLRYRQGGERFRPQGRQHSQLLKKLLQEAGVPPWERDHVPLLYLGDTLVAVAGLWPAADFTADNEPGWQVLVQPAAGESA